MAFFTSPRCSKASSANAELEKQIKAEISRGKRIPLVRRDKSRELEVHGIQPAGAQLTDAFGDRIADRLNSAQWQSFGGVYFERDRLAGQRQPLLESQSFRSAADRLIWILRCACWHREAFYHGPSG